jgi:hypothetical protein
MQLRNMIPKERGYFNKSVQVHTHVPLLHSDDSSHGHTEDETLLTD